MASNQQVFMDPYTYWRRQTTPESQALGKICPGSDPRRTPRDQFSGSTVRNSQNIRNLSKVLTWEPSEMVKTRRH